MTKHNKIELATWFQKGRFFEFENHDIFLAQQGYGSKTLLCVHGFPTSSYDYRKILPGLLEDFRVVTFDLIGYGFSDKPFDFDYTTNAQADLLSALVRHIDVDSVHLLTHDFGNTIAQELLARRKEDKLEFEIESLAMLNGALFPETHRPVLAQRLLIGPIGPLFGRMIPDFAFKKSLASIFGQNYRPSDAELDDFVVAFRANDGKKIAHKLIQYMRERAIHRERWLGGLASIDFPFLFINGSADPVSGKHVVDRFRELLPNLTNIVEYADVGHFPHLERPNDVLIDFLAFHKQT
ncbi:MAG: alpha/beta hydrolase [Pyrinomonadaceae bacterium]